jgi:hypothetical protein
MLSDVGSSTDDNGCSAEIAYKVTVHSSYGEAEDTINRAS